VCWQGSSGLAVTGFSSYQTLVDPQHLIDRLVSPLAANSRPARPTSATRAWNCQPHRHLGFPLHPQDVGLAGQTLSLVSICSTRGRQAECQDDSYERGGRVYVEGTGRSGTVTFRCPFRPFLVC
jgi:hypothetical protein